MGQQSEWGEEESRELIAIRGEVERNLGGIKRNKKVWEIVSVQMREKGHARTPDQCKCKWKNLVNRYKNQPTGVQGKETSDPETGRQRNFLFFDELHEVFSERAKIMQPKTKTRLSEDEEDGETGANRSNSGKRKAERDVPEMVKEMLEQQVKLEMEWRVMMEKHAHKRQMFEQEWRQSMEKRERERLIAHQNWLEEEEQRRIRDEKRAETRHALFTSLLTQLLDQN